MSKTVAAAPVTVGVTLPSHRHQFAIAWFIALTFYVLEYATRSAPAVMLPQLAHAYSVSETGVSSILGAYYYTYSVTSLVAGVALDRMGAKMAVPFGSALLGLGCLLFAISSMGDAYVGRLLQGAGSSFAFTGAVYLAARGFSPKSLATAIGATQCMGMLGGSAGQFVVGPLVAGGIAWQAIWIAFGIAGLIIAAGIFLITPKPDAPMTVAHLAPGALLQPFKIVLTNPQSYLSGLIAGLLFVPTTVGALTWGVAFGEHDLHLDFQHAVTATAMVPLGWVVGCPIMGKLTDWIGLRKPVLIGGGLFMLAAAAQVAFLPTLFSPLIGLFLFGVGSGVAMIPYSIIKEANPDGVKGSATGTINFLNFGITALVGPLFGLLFGKTLATTSDHLMHFRQAGLFWIGAIVLAILLSLVVRETGHRKGDPAVPAA